MKAVRLPDQQVGGGQIEHSSPKQTARDHTYQFKGMLP
jgi:hypothetical protein